MPAVIHMVDQRAALARRLTRRAARDRALCLCFALAVVVVFLFCLGLVAR